jgi:hypothetical protein
MAKSFYGKVQFDADLLEGNDRFQWEQTVLAALNEIWRSFTGRNLLDVIGAHAKIVKIVPYYGSDINAFAGPRSDMDAYYKDRPRRSAEDGTRSVGTETGTGRGTGVRLEYTPWRFAAQQQKIVLLHEMVHACAMQRGVIYYNQVISNPAFDTVAEFDAILVENIFCSEMGLPLRKDHGGGTRTGTRMLPNERELSALVSSFKNRLPELADALSKVAVPFNPLRAGNQAAPR